MFADKYVTPYLSALENAIVFSGGLQMSRFTLLFYLLTYLNFNCSIFRTRLRHVDRVFAATGPRVWDSLPIYICQLDLMLGQFYRPLKTHVSSRN